MPSERLEQLKQQKALVQQHLDWIDQEIDRERVESEAVAEPVAYRLAEPVDSNKRVAESLDLESQPSARVATDLYDELGPDTKTATAETKKGCLLIGGVALASVAAICTYVIYFY